MGEPENYNRKELIHRIGTFFLLIAVGLLVYFILSDSVGEPRFDLFCLGVLISGIGFFFRSQLKRPSPSSGRFGWMKRFLKGKEE
ncbi:MAG TPA: hypothetical protein PLA27_09065 [Anaerolineales bacterium]|jgi:hypothetical protein|nr:hypothetical protein [Anaerolineales bacterium]HQX16558.1 hypothetical protein [Anaerolineales bacterium]